jgi:hypothetical protein
MPRGELSCQEFVELVTEYLHGTLPGPEHQRFESHAARCAECGAFLEQMRLAIRMVGSLGAEAVSEAALTPLLVAFRGWKRDRAADG